MFHRISAVAEQKSVLALLFMLGGATLMLFTFGMDLLGISSPGVSPNQVSLALSGLAMILVGLVLVIPFSRRPLVEWLLVAASVLAVAFASDLFIAGALAGNGPKQLALLSTLLAVICVSAIPVTSPDKKLTAALAELRHIDRAAVLQFVAVVAQLLLLVLVIRRYEIENKAFYTSVMLVTFYGFLLHFFLPLPYRLPFFLFISVATILSILGISNGLWLLGAGLALIALAHLPVRMLYRTALLLGVGLLLMAARAELIPSPIPAIVWPVLGSMFMFRLIVYMYDLQHAKQPVTPWQSLSYFFLLPNVVFLFFPVVDFAAFRRTYFNGPRFAGYQRGLDWMLRGVIQLLAYRIINLYLVTGPEEVTNAWQAAVYAIVNFSLYLRISGQFHLIIGLLHLFGFNLPETNIRYFLSSSFTDLWRRVNIYWKDFMQKVFFYPSYFRLSRLGPMGSLTAATVVVFVMTWFLHSYQWFWLRGSFLITVPDIVFWFLLASLVLANTLREAKRGRKRTLAQPALTIRELGARSFRVAGTMSILMFLWTLWTSATVADWLSLWSVVLNPLGIATLALVFLGIMLFVAAAIWLTGDTGQVGAVRARKSPSFSQKVVLNGVALAGLLIIANPAVYNRLGERIAGFMENVSVQRLSDRDAQLLLRGYYEDLTGVSRFNSDLWDLYSKRPTEWPLIQDTESARLTGDYLALELIPNQSAEFHGALFSTNSWGMRDQEYALTPEPGTLRAVLLGPSFVMGSGVADNEVFEWLVEDRLNAEAAGGPYDRFEILNMGVAGYSALQEQYLLEHRAFDFQPAVIFYVGHQLELQNTMRGLASLIAKGVEIPYPHLLDIARQAGITPGMSEGEAEQLLQPYGREIIAWIYDQMAAQAREHDAEFVWIFMPALEIPVDREEADSLFELATAAGFTTIDLSDVYNGHNVEELIVAEWDKHPNALGHRLLAEGLYQALQNIEFPAKFPGN